MQTKPLNPYTLCVDEMAVGTEMGTLQTPCSSMHSASKLALEAKPVQ